MSGIKIHERTLPVAQAENEAAMWLLDWETRHSLTPGEVVGFLSSRISEQAKYMRREERHGDASKKGDEA